LKRMRGLGYPFHFVVTATTRPRRPNEVDGVDYHFVSKQELESGKDVIMRIDVQGAATIRDLVPEALFIFLTASSEEELIRRLRKRRTETSEGLKRRIARAQEEMKRLDEFDYVVVNRNSHLDQTVETIAAIITAEKCKVKQRKIELQGGVR